jgi:dihydrofolate synthase/folylpolyglutamate synthase
VNYPEAIQFLFGLRLFGVNFGLENTFQLAALAGKPQEKLRFIHVAGTNGKGSSCAMLESIYRAAGLRVGLFTSPHLVSFRERIQVNRRLIPEDNVVHLVTEIQSWLKEFPADHHPTFFEVITVMALKFFAEQKCDLVIWETGLGGRLDATNIVTPLASVITNIALDHQQWLGDTLEKIAAEKAGIIKPGVPILTTAAEPGALTVIEDIAREKNAPLTRVPPLPAANPAISTSLLGEHQRINTALALATVETLQPQIPVSEEKIRSGLSSVDWPGRLQMVERPGGQKILLDGAHNVAGAETLRAALKKDFANSRPVFIFGALADKNWPEICQILAPLASRFIAVPVTSDRTTDAHEVANVVRTANPALASTVCKNLVTALGASQGEPLVVITGSLYLVGEALETLGLSPLATNERALNEWTAPARDTRDVR